MKANVTLFIEYIIGNYTKGKTPSQDCKIDKRITQMICSIRKAKTQSYALKRH